MTQPYGVLRQHVTNVLGYLGGPLGASPQLSFFQVFTTLTSFDDTICSNTDNDTAIAIPKAACFLYLCHPVTAYTNPLGQNKRWQMLWIHGLLNL